MERKWVTVAFLDLTGFRSWTYRAATAPEHQEQFIKKFYEVLQSYVCANLDTWAKYEGDGLLIVKEFSDAARKDKRSLLDFILGLRCLFRKVKRVLKESENPPAGVRIRQMDGYVFKLMVLDPNDSKRKRQIPEYLGYCTNTVRGLLEINPEIPSLATEDLVKKLGRAKKILRPRPHRTPSCYPKGVNREDVDGLWRLKF